MGASVCAAARDTAARAHSAHARFARMLSHSETELWCYVVARALK